MAKHPIEKFINSKINEKKVTFTELKKAVRRLLDSGGRGYFMDDYDIQVLIYHQDFPSHCADIRTNKYIINDERLERELLNDETFRAFYNIS